MKYIILGLSFVLLLFPVIVGAEDWRDYKTVNNVTTIAGCEKFTTVTFIACLDTNMVTRVTGVKVPNKVSDRVLFCSNLRNRMNKECKIRVIRASYGIKKNKIDSNNKIRTISW